MLRETAQKKPLYSRKCLKNKGLSVAQWLKMRKIYQQEKKIPCANLLKNGRIYYKSCTLTQKHCRNILRIQNNRLRKGAQNITDIRGMAGEEKPEAPHDTVCYTSAGRFRETVKFQKKIGRIFQDEKESN